MSVDVKRFTVNRLHGTFIHDGVIAAHEEHASRNIDHAVICLECSRAIVDRAFIDGIFQVGDEGGNGGVLNNGAP